ncbi:MAG: AraC family transcriptional regulator [Chthoniobacteraceae bacterium]|nr:AraC family transcriptional regulator [Chthoniobacteraceae bacterium]
MNHMRRQPNTSAHHHDCLEMAFLLGGEGVHRTTSGETPCGAGQIFLIPPGVWHAYDRCRNLELYNCLLSQALLDGPLAWTAQDPALGPLLSPAPWQGGSQVLTWVLQKGALSMVRRLLVALARTYRETGVSRQGKLVSELLMLLDYVAMESSPTHALEPMAVHSAVRRAAELLRADLARGWSLPELAGELRIHPSYLARLFRQATDCAPMKFLARERAHKAAQLLLITDWPVSEIGGRVGWEDPKQFARSFHQHFGEAASAFRRRMRRNSAGEGAGRD